jgi:hypothetical protein
MDELSFAGLSHRESGEWFPRFPLALRRRAVGLSIWRRAAIN